MVISGCQKQNEQYHIHTLGKAIYFRKSFLEATGTMGTPEYNTLMELQAKHPNFKLLPWSIAEPKKKKESYKGLTLERMDAFLKWKYKNNQADYDAVKAEFDGIKGFCDEFHKGSSGGNCKKWFLERYKDEYLNWAKKKAKLEKKKDETAENAGESNNNTAEPTENTQEPIPNANESASSEQ